SRRPSFSFGDKLFPSTCLRLAVRSGNGAGSKDRGAGVLRSVRPPDGGHGSSKSQPAGTLVRHASLRRSRPNRGKSRSQAGTDALLRTGILGPTPSGSPDRIQPLLQLGRSP